MGICFQDARLMCESLDAGASFDSVLTIGRQSLCLHPEELDFFRRRSAAVAGLPRESLAFGAFAEPFLHACLGAGTVEALDYSDYDGARHVHDLNEPVPESLVGRFDVVLDGGSLEHIFNFPTAVANLMRMAKVGGRVFMSNPTNNFCGHGFYQFSPELMFRVFAPENGFEIRTVRAFEVGYPQAELTRNRVAYVVADPEAVRSRVGLVTKRPVMMLVEARKLQHVSLFARAPLQSDYVSTWSAANATGKGDQGTRAVPRGIWRSRVLAVIPRSLRVHLQGWVQNRRFSFGNHRFFRRVS